MNAVWNSDLYQLIKPVGTALLNVMAGVTAGLASSRIPNLGSQSGSTRTANPSHSQHRKQYTGGTVPSFCRLCKITLNPSKDAAFSLFYLR